MICVNRDFYHHGPAQVWLSRAPNNDLRSYRGTGDFFKIAYSGPLNSSYWKLTGSTEFNFTLPATTPPGAYLVRFEHFMPSSTAESQWFINCALVQIHSPPNTVPGTPSGFLRFPGEGGKWPYDKNDYGLYVPFNQYVGDVPEEQMRLQDYKPPGPSVWAG